MVIMYDSLHERLSKFSATARMNWHTLIPAFKPTNQNPGAAKLAHGVSQT